MKKGNHALTVVGSSTSNIPAFFTSISPYSPMHQIVTRTKLTYRTKIILTINKKLKLKCKKPEN